MALATRKLGVTGKWGRSLRGTADAQPDHLVQHILRLIRDDDVDNVAAKRIARNRQRRRVAKKKALVAGE